VLPLVPAPSTPRVYTGSWPGPFTDTTAWGPVIFESIVAVDRHHNRDHNKSRHTPWLCLSMFCKTLSCLQASISEMHTLRSWWYLPLALDGYKGAPTSLNDWDAQYLEAKESWMWRRDRPEDARQPTNVSTRTSHQQDPKLMHQRSTRTKIDPRRDLQKTHRGPKSDLNDVTFEHSREWVRRQSVEALFV